MARHRLGGRTATGNGLFGFLGREADVFQQMGVEPLQGGELPMPRMRRPDAAEPELPQEIQDRVEGWHGGRSFGRQAQDAPRSCINEAFELYAKHEKIFGMQRLNLDQLSTFVKVVEAGSFSAAAEKLGLTQPAVSLQIRQLEK